VKKERCNNDSGLTGYEKKLKKLCENIRDAESVCAGLKILLEFIHEEDEFTQID
jgi:hypothetical protein